MAWKWYEGRLEKIERMSSTTRKFWVRVEENFEFIAGQFVTMDLPISEKRLKRWRSYSIANISNDENLLEFCIVQLEEGLGTKYLFEDVKVGDNLKFKGPSGTFYLPEKIESNLVFICTGTGVAPFRSMILDIQNRKRSHQNIHLIFGTREEEGILYRSELEKWAESDDRFTYDVALSRSESWKGHKGYVHDIYMNQYMNRRENTNFYLCGWTQMIDEAVGNLFMKMKIDKSKIHYELYG